MSSKSLVRLVDTVEECQDAVAALCQETEVAIDIEGVDLSRAGEVCLIQMCSHSNPMVYLFDIHVLGERAFGIGGLRNLLESDDVTKLFFDVRSDNDALYHLHNVKVRAAYDIQIMWHLKFQNGADIYLQGLKKLLATYLKESDVLTTDAALALGQLKERGLRLFAPEHGGSYEVWKQRPLQSDIQEYAAADVMFLLGMKRHWASTDPNLVCALDTQVKEMTSTRVLKFVSLPNTQALNQEGKKFVDFEIVDGFNESGDISEKIFVPSDLKGRVIGKRGVTIQAIQSSSGARVTLNGSYALVVGQPTQVQAAAKQVRRLIS